MKRALKLLPTKVDDLQWPDFDEDLLVAKLEVKSAIRFLRAVSEKPFWSNKSENRTSLEAVRDAVQPLREAFAKAPGEALAALFLEGDIADTEVPPKAAWDVVTKRLRTVVSLLDNIEARCGELLSSPPGIHGSAGFRQKQAAARAWDLLTTRGLKPTTPATGLFHHITRLLHEAVEGPSDADLSRAMLTAIRRASSLVKTKPACGGPMTFPKFCAVFAAKCISIHAAILSTSRKIGKRFAE